LPFEGKISLSEAVDEVVVFEKSQTLPLFVVYTM